MNKQGSIAHFETEADAHFAGYRTKLSESEAKLVSGLNRSERRKALAENRCERRAIARQQSKRGR